MKMTIEDCRPLTDDQLDFLDLILSKYGDDQSILSVSELHGYITAVVSGPESIAPSEWFAEIWGPDAEPVWENEQEMATFFGVLVQKMNYTLSVLMDHPEEFQALFFVMGENDDDEHLVVEDWCLGYVRGISLRSEQWEKLPHALVEEGLAPILMFASDEMLPMLEQLNTEQIHQLQLELEPSACLLYDYWYRQRSQPQTVYVESKVGRNEPCSCGSGKKYKKCCGLN